MPEKIEPEIVDYEAVYQYERHLIPVRKLCPGIDRRFAWEGANSEHVVPCKWLEHYASAFHFTDVEIWASRSTAMMPTASGVYFMFDEETCIYIGQTNNFFNRAMQHKRNRMRWTSHAYFEAPKTHAPDIEAYYIRRIRPIMNSSYPALNAYSRIVEKLGLDRVACDPTPAGLQPT
jgi:hypothetical protein